MQIKNLSHLSNATEESVFGGTYYYPSYDYKFTKKVDIDVDADYNVDVHVNGYSSEITFDLLAMGYGATTDGEFQAVADSYQGVALLEGNFYAASSY